MVDSVYANPDELRQLQSTIAKARQDIEAILDRVPAALAETTWRDARRDDLETRLLATTAGIRQVIQRMDDLTLVLTREADALDSYLRRGLAT